MKYETRLVDAEKGIVQITTEDERFYSKPVDGKVVYIPSVTWICGYLPKGVPFYKWLASKGWDESQAIMEEAGERGTMIHKAVEMLIAGQTVKYNTVINDRELTADEYSAVMSFVAWYKEAQPEIYKSEFTVFSPDDRYAGTIDLLCKINKGWWVVDFKTGQSIWPSHEIQLTAYQHAIGEEGVQTAIVQLGYQRNKKHFKWTPIDDKWKLFNAAYDIWENECAGISPLQREYPLELTLNLGGENDTTKNK
jgi:hypothetical protein